MPSPPVSPAAAEPPTPLAPPRVFQCILLCMVGATMATLYQGACALSSISGGSGFNLYGAFMGPVMSNSKPGPVNVQTRIA